MLLVYVLVALLVVGVLWLVLGRRTPPPSPGPAPRQASPDDDADFLRDLGKRLRDPREE